ncbi:MAG: hypothetical protein ACR2N0_13560 [Rubrobacteraceae bacterium]
MMDMMNRCMDMMGSMMGGIVFFILLVMLLVFLIGVTALGAAGVWGYRRLTR